MVFNGISAQKAISAKTDSQTASITYITYRHISSWSTKAFSPITQFFDYPTVFEWNNPCLCFCFFCSVICNNEKKTLNQQLHKTDNLERWKPILALLARQHFEQCTGLTACITGKVSLGKCEGNTIQSTHNPPHQNIYILHSNHVHVRRFMLAVVRHTVFIYITVPTHWLDNSRPKQLFQRY